MDEPTSALDPASESVVIHGLLRLRRHMTIVRAGHRPATIRNAGRIIVLIGAEVAAEGTHAELTATSGVYRNLFVDTHDPEDLQTDGFQHLQGVNLEKRIRT